MNRGADPLVRAGRLVPPVCRSINHFHHTTRRPGGRPADGASALQFMPANTPLKGAAASRHSAGVKTILCLVLLFAPYAAADETADRAAIRHTIARLNELPRHPSLFTADSDAPSELERLPKAATQVIHSLRSGHLTVTISHEPWGEATFDFPVALHILKPRIVCGAIRLITADVALAEGTWSDRNFGAPIQTIPLLFVMKKEGDAWKIAALRMVAPH